MGDLVSIPGLGDPWRREWLPTPIFWPGEFHGQRSLMCYSPWGCKGSDILNDFHFHAAYSNCWHDPHGETVETMSDFVFWGSKITADGDRSHEIKRHLLLGRKVMTNLDSIFKSRDITLPTKVHLVKAMVFSSGHVWM